MTDRASFAAIVFAFIVQLALVSLGVYFISDALGKSLEFSQIATISCALLIIQSGMSVKVSRS